MKVKELIEKLSKVDGDLEVSLVIESGRGISMSEDFYVGFDGDGISLSGVEDYYE